MPHPRANCKPDAQAKNLLPGQFGYLSISDFCMEPNKRMSVDPDAPLCMTHSPYEELKLARDKRGRWSVTFIAGQETGSCASKVPARGNIHITELNVSPRDVLRFADIIDPLTLDGPPSGDAWGWVDRDAIVTGRGELKEHVDFTIRVYRQSSKTTNRVRVQVGKRGCWVRLGGPLSKWQEVHLM